MVTPQGQRSKRPGRIAAIAGVIAIALVAAAALLATVFRSDESGEPLYVLPVPADGWQLTNGSVIDPNGDAPATAEQFVASGRLFGATRGDGYVDLRSLSFYDDDPRPGAEWETAGEQSDYRRVDDSITLATENGDGTWRVASSPDDLLHAYDPEGIPDSIAIIAAFTSIDEPAGPTSSFEMASANDSTFTVVTAISASPLFEVATYADRIDPIDIGDSTAWVVTDELDDPTDAVETTVTWSPETDRTVSVRSTAPRDEAIDAARSLQPVTADDWAKAFPDAQAN